MERLLFKSRLEGHYGLLIGSQDLKEISDKIISSGGEYELFKYCFNQSIRSCLNVKYGWMFF